jgi:DNA-binding CsgD family transcriptional regulator
MQQALYYNLAVLLTAVLDFMHNYFWKQVSENTIALNFLTIIHLSNIIAATLWCYSFVIMIYSFLDIRLELKNTMWFKIGSGIAILSLFISFISSVFNIIPILPVIISFSFCYLLFSISLGYSIFLYKKATLLTNVDRKKSLKSFGILFIVFSALSLYSYVEAYPLHLLPRIVSKFSLNLLDFIFNAFTLFWVIRYFRYLDNGPQITESNSLPESELVSKFQISKRELDIIHLVCSGKSNQEIADTLFISLGTVKDHLYNIYKKVGIKNRTQLAKLF